MSKKSMKVNEEEKMNLLFVVIRRPKYFCYLRRFLPSWRGELTPPPFPLRSKILRSFVFSLFMEQQSCVKYVPYSTKTTILWFYKKGLQ